MRQQGHSFAGAGADLDARIGRGFAVPSHMGEKPRSAQYNKGRLHGDLGDIALAIGLDLAEFALFEARAAEFELAHFDIAHFLAREGFLYVQEAFEVAAFVEVGPDKTAAGVDRAVGDADLIGKGRTRWAEQLDAIEPIFGA